MKPLSYLSSSDGVLVADTSAIINISATGCASQILRALPHKVLVVDAVLNELNEGLNKGRQDAHSIAHLIDARLIEVAALDEVGMRHFESLVVGPATDTLDDGEAATLAYAVQSGSVAIIDERKAIRICAARFSNIVTVSSVDVFAHTTIEAEMGREALGEAIFAALRDARMRVPENHIEWIVELIGQERACQCASLPGRIRNQKPARSA